MHTWALKVATSDRSRYGFLALTFLFLISVVPSTIAAPGSELWSKWQGHNANSQTRMDHGFWDRFLKSYVNTDDTDGIHRVRYVSVSPQDRQQLEAYVSMLQQVPVTSLNRGEQQAYWINLYNALTVKVILEHYPVRSIRDIDISPGWFADGPWGAKLLKIEGENVSLDDIEHRILRPIWKDNRVHYAVNCASLGCPNLQPEAFSPENMERLLEQGARQYVNHERGAHIEKGKLTLSSIYKWFQVDFGGSKEGVITHLLQYADKPMAESLKGFKGKISYHYDWALNE